MVLTIRTMAPVVAAGWLVAGCGADPAWVTDDGGTGSSDDVASVDAGAADVAPDGTDDAVERDAEGADAETDTEPSDVVDRDATDATSDAEADAATDVDVGDTADATSDAERVDVSIDVDPDCDATPSLTLASDTVEMWSFGEAIAASVPAALDGDICGDVQALTTAAWLSAEWTGTAIALAIDEDALPSGRGRETVAVAHAGTPALLASLQVEWHVMPRPNPDARPHVLVIGVDGMRPDAMMYAHTPMFDVLRDHGAWTLDGRTQDTTVTDSSAGWASLFTGVDSDKHGVLNNGGIGGWDRSWPTFAWRAHEAGITTAMVAQWIPALAQLHEDGAFDWSSIGGGSVVSDQIVDRLAEHDDELLLTHFDDVDHAGHASGFTPVNPEYVEAIEETDANARDMIEAILDRPDLAAEDWLIVVMTDHGGEGTNHGPMNLPNQRIPFIFTGSGRPRGEILGPAVTHMDVAPTVLEHLGVGPDDDWDLDGRPRGVDPARLDPDARPPTLETNCDDRIDDDGDALLDCADPDCAAVEGCAPVCADRSIGSAVGDAVAVGDNTGADTDYRITCARLDGARDESMAWTAPSEGRWRIDTVGSDVDTILAVWRDECVAPFAPVACNDDTDGYSSEVTIDAAADEVWTIVVTGFDGRSGAWVVNIHPADEKVADGEHDHSACRHGHP